MWFVTEVFTNTNLKTTRKIWWLWQKKNVVFGGDFNLIFDCKFDASGGNPILKRRL